MKGRLCFGFATLLFCPHVTVFQTQRNTEEFVRKGSFETFLQNEEERIYMQNTGEGIYRKDVKWLTLTLEQKQTCTRAKAFPGSCSLARTRIVTPARNASVPLSGFRKMLYVYLMLPAQRRLLGPRCLKIRRVTLEAKGLIIPTALKPRWLCSVKSRRKDEEKEKIHLSGLLDY